jgi:hypothetical protein
VGNGRAVQSFGAVSGGRLAGAVEVGGQWYYGQHDGDDFRVFRLAATGPVRAGSFPIEGMHHASVVRTFDASRLGILLRTRAGTWFVFPLSDDDDAELRAQLPLSLSRDALNASPPRCGDDETGWLVVASTPLTRLDGGGKGGSITLVGSEAGLRASDLTAKVLVRDGALCVLELAALVTHKDAPESLPAPSPTLPRESVELLLHDPFSQRRLEFRCSL